MGFISLNGGSEIYRDFCVPRQLKLSKREDMAGGSLDTSYNSLPKSFSNLLPSLLSHIVVTFVQNEVSHCETETNDATIKSKNFFFSFLLLFVGQMPIEEAQMWHRTCIDTINCNRME